MKVLILGSVLLFGAGCTIMPHYRLQERAFCVQKPWDSYCDGFFDDEVPLYDAKSVYDD